MSKLVPDEVILGLLKDKPSHGYELLEKFKSFDNLGRIWTMSTSQLYFVLKRLDAKGAVVGAKLETGAAPSRVVYTVTELGEQIIEKWLYNPHPSPSIHRIRVLFISRIYIANLIGYPIEPIVSAQLSSCKNQHEKLLRRKRQSTSEIERLTLNYIINQLEGAILWIEQSRFRLNT